MGNANSSPRANNSKQKKSKKAEAWGWEFKDGRAFMRPRAPATRPARPLFRKQPSDNYDWWIFNPELSKSKRRNTNS